MVGLWPWALWSRLAPARGRFRTKALNTCMRKGSGSLSWPCCGNEGVRAPDSRYALSDCLPRCASPASSLIATRPSVTEAACRDRDRATSPAEPGGGSSGILGSPAGPCMPRLGSTSFRYAKPPALPDRYPCRRPLSEVVPPGCPGGDKQPPRPPGHSLRTKSRYGLGRLTKSTSPYSYEIAAKAL